MQKVFNDFGVFSLIENDYKTHLGYVSKKEAINLLKCADLKIKFQTF